jgi:hypothetical protein
MNVDILLSNLVVVGVGGGEPVVGTETQLLHDALQSRVDISGQVTGGQVPGDELVGDGDDVTEVSCQAEVKHCELMTLQGILEQTVNTQAKTG